jgi:hypothetical protein
VKLVQNNRNDLSLFNFRWPFPRPIIVKRYVCGELVKEEWRADDADESSRESSLSI